MKALPRELATDPTVVAATLSRVAMPSEWGACWRWTGSTLASGYGRLYVRGTTYRAHRLTFELSRGPIPAGLVLDHLCRNKLCVNPLHLDPVTDHVNLHRGETVTAANAAKTHCYKDHEFTDENTTYSRAGHRVCRKCRQDRDDRRRGKPVRDELAPYQGAPAARTHCKHGHEFTPENTYLRPSGGRRCLTCARRVNAESARRVRAKAAGRAVS